MKHSIQEISAGLAPRAFMIMLRTCALAACLFGNHLLWRAAAIETNGQASSNAPSAAPHAIEPEVAAWVASDRVAAYYPGPWAAVTEVTYYALNGTPAAFAFVFSREGSLIRTPAELRQHLVSAEGQRARTGGAHAPSDASSDAESAAASAQDAPYGFEQFATVVTGALDDSPLVLAHHRGLPPVIAEGPRLERLLKQGAFGAPAELGPIIQLNTFDQRYTITADSALAKRELQKVPAPVAQAFSTDTRILAPRTEVMTLLRELKSAAAKKDEAKKRALEKMSDAKQRQLREAQAQRATLNRQQWDRFRERLMKERSAAK